MLGMRRLLAHVVLAAGFLLLPVASAQAVEPPTDVSVTFVPGAPAHLSVSFTPSPLDLLATYEVWMCQSSASCVPGTGPGGTVTEGGGSPIDPVAVAVTDFGCLVQVYTKDVLGEYSAPAPATPVLVPQCDQIAPVLTTSFTGGNGCVPFVVSGSAVDNTQPVTVLAGGQPVPHTVTAGGTIAPYDTVSVTVTAADGVPGTPNVSTAPPVIGRVEDTTPPGATTLEVSTDPPLQKATLTWDPAPVDGAPLDSYRLRAKGPGAPAQSTATSPFVVPNMQVDATYEFTLDAMDQCNRFGPSSVRLVRLNDTAPPSMPILAGPAFDPISHVVRLAWIAATDNIQVDHYTILRNGVPIGATDAAVFTDPLPGEHADRTYVVRAVDTNGNTTDSAAATITTPDWTPPTAPVPTIAVQGATATLSWKPAADNVGVVAYDVLRDEKQIATMTSAVRTFRDVGVPPATHTWKVVARDDAGLTAVSAPLVWKIARPAARATFIAMRMAGSGRTAARYTLARPRRLLLDLRVVGDLPKAKLRLYVQSGRGRITVWRGTPGSSATRLRLGSALVRRGFVTIDLHRTLHAGRIRLVLIASRRVVIVATHKREPRVRAG
jgi:hypothetical protein